MITNITIKNIKGFDGTGRSIPVEINPRKVNLLIAPNGFGKSSIAAAFDSLKPHSLDVDKDLKYHRDEALQASLSMTIDGTVYTADASKNDIDTVLRPYVIKSNTAVHTTQRNLTKYTTVSGYLDIDDIVIYDNIPKDIKPKTTFTAVKNEFGKNSKVLTNYTSHLQDDNFYLGWAKCFDSFESFRTTKGRKSLIAAALAELNAKSGTAEQIRQQITDNIFDAIETEPCYVNFKAAMEYLTKDLSRCETFFLFFQMFQVWDKEKDAVRAAFTRATYNRKKARFDFDLHLLDSTWKEIHTEEVRNGEKTALVVKYPRAGEISNGQRDVLTFVTELIKFRLTFKKGRKYLLLIDEVFDYLDDANTIAAQYYLSNMIDMDRGNVYVAMLTHLNPFTFRNYMFSKSLMNVQYLYKNVPLASDKMKTFIAYREELLQKGDKRTAQEETLYNKMSSYLFHYNPSIINVQPELAALNKNNMVASWGRSEVLKQHLTDNVNLYLQGNKQYDPYAVAMALRLRVEKLVYEMLGDENQKKEYLDTHMTRKKFQKIEDWGYSLPNVFNLVSAIHNDADHISLDSMNLTFNANGVVYKLENSVIQHLVGKLFNYIGQTLTPDVI